MIKRLLKWLNEPAPEARELRCHRIKFVPTVYGKFTKYHVVNDETHITHEGCLGVWLEKSDIEFLMESEA